MEILTFRKPDGRREAEEDDREEEDDRGEDIGETDPSDARFVLLRQCDGFLELMRIKSSREIIPLQGGRPQQ